MTEEQKAVIFFSALLIKVASIARGGVSAEPDMCFATARQMVEAAARADLLPRFNALKRPKKFTNKGRKS